MLSVQSEQNVKQKNCLKPPANVIEHCVDFLFILTKLGLLLKDAGEQDVQKDGPFTLPWDASSRT